MNKVLFTIISFLGYFNFYVSWKDETEIEYEIESLNFGKASKGKLTREKAKAFINLIDEIDLFEIDEDEYETDEVENCCGIKTIYDDGVKYNLMIVRNGIAHSSVWYKNYEPENIDNLFKAIKLCNKNFKSY